MILSCPKCSVKYSLDPARLGAEGRTVRCSRCEHEWWQEPEETEEEIVFDDGDDAGGEDDSFAEVLERFEEDDDRADRPPEPFRLPDREPGVEDIEDEETARESGRFAIACFVLLVLLTVSIAFAEKYRITNAWPPSIRFYEALGVDIPVKGEGLRISDLTARADAEDMNIMIEARVANIIETPVAVPEIALVMQDENGQTVREERLRKEDAVMQPGESQPLAVTLQNVPPDAKSVIIRVAQ